MQSEIACGSMLVETLDELTLERMMSWAVASFCERYFESSVAIYEVKATASSRTIQFEIEPM